MRKNRKREKGKEEGEGEVGGRTARGRKGRWKSRRVDKKRKI